MQRIFHYCTALRLASYLIVCWLIACYRLDRILSAQTRQRYFPQLQAGVVFDGCRAILRQASQPSLFDEIDRQRTDCHKLWQAIQGLPTRPGQIQSPAGRRMLNVALERSIELILGSDCWTPDSSLECSQHSLRDALLYWLKNAGADRRQATFRSLRNTTSLINSAVCIDEANLSREQIATLETVQHRLRSKLIHISGKKIQQAIEHEYTAHHVALLAAPTALVQALAQRPRINKPR